MAAQRTTTSLGDTRLQLPPLLLFQVRLEVLRVEIQLRAVVAKPRGRFRFDDIVPYAKIDDFRHCLLLEFLAFVKLQGASAVL